MDKFRRLPKRFRFILVVLGLNLLLFTIFRLVFYLAFRSTAAEAPWVDCFYLGLKFDLRVALIVALPFVALSWIPRLNLPLTRLGRRVWLSYFTTVAVVCFLLYIVDLGHYAYVRERLNASVIDYILSPDIATQMVSETYPVGWALLGTLLFGAGYAWTIRKLAIPELEKDGDPLPRARKIVVLSATILLGLLALYGKLSWYPLRWSDAYFSTNPFATALATNPIHYVFDTLHVRKESFDLDVVRAHYALMADYLDVPPSDRTGLNFARSIRPERQPNVQPNIVVIFLESLAAYKTGLFGNKLNPTPHFDAIARQSVVFNHFFVPKPPTARSIFTAFTGIPDIHRNHSSSRNPRIINQQTIVSAFTGYEKLYFIGGSASWGNIRGIVANNVSDARIYEEGDYSAPRNDVWGLSDLHLFEEANNVLRTRQEPFLAFIQTAGNHRPFTIPDDHRGFKKQFPSREEVLAVGFDSLEEFNGIRFMDHSINFFFRTAAKESYFKNTIFIMFGDHGTASHIPSAWEKLHLTSHHVPLVLYSPTFIPAPKVIETIASSVDVLPTAAGLAGLPYVNTTLGRDLFRPKPGKTYYAFIAHDPDWALLDDEFMYRLEPNGVERLFRYRSDQADVDVGAWYPERMKEMGRLCLAYRETSKYMLHHNKPLKR